MTRQLIDLPMTTAELKAAAQKWLDTMADGNANSEATDAYVKALEDDVLPACPCPAVAGAVAAAACSAASSSARALL